MNNEIIRIVEIFDKVNGTHILSEGLRSASTFVKNGSISSDSFNKLVSIDPTPKKKYIHWIVKNWVEQTQNDPKIGPSDEVIMELSDLIKNYHNLSERNKIEKKDINQIRNFEELTAIVQSGKDVKSKSDKINNYEVIIDNDDMLIVVPYDHAAARMLGMKYFNFRYMTHRKNPTEDDKDCAWCIAFKNDDHFNDYYHTDELTFYMIRLKSEELIEKVRAHYNVNTQEYDGIIIGVYPNGSRIGYTGLDNSMDDIDIKMYLKIIGVE